MTKAGWFVVCCGDCNEVVLLDPTMMTRRIWRAPINQPHGTPAITLDGRIVVASFHDDCMYVLHGDTGAVLHRCA